MRQKTGSVPVAPGAKKTGRLTVVGVVLLASLVLLAGATAATRSSAAASLQGDAAGLIGKWLGPMPGNAEKCGSAYSEYVFQRDKSYSWHSNSENCGSFTTYGVYEVRNNSIYFHQRKATPGVPQTAEYSAPYRLKGPDVLMLNDEGTDRWFTYHRQ